MDIREIYCSSLSLDLARFTDCDENAIINFDDKFIRPVKCNHAVM